MYFKPISRLLLYQLFAISTMVLFSGPAVFAQSEEQDLAEADEKPDLNMELRYTEINNATKTLTATVKVKEEDTWVRVADLPVNFYRKTVDAANLIGTAVTNKKGVAVFFLPDGEAAQFAPDLAYVYIAAVENNPKYADGEEEITVYESNFNMDLKEEDSVRYVNITLEGINEENEMAPAAEVDVNIYVKRLFSLLPLTEDPETTDENGEISFEFPAGIPGDSTGNLIIVAKVDDNERFGYLEFRKKIAWGKPVIADSGMRTRELWSSRANAPIYLIVIVNAMLIGIWGVILYIIFEVLKIKKIGRQAMNS